MTLDRAVLFKGELQNGHVDVPGQEWARERTIIRRDGEEVVIEIFSGGFRPRFRAAPASTSPSSRRPWRSSAGRTNEVRPAHAFVEALMGGADLMAPGAGRQDPHAPRLGMDQEPPQGAV
jgi:hypothetical protein